MGVRRRRSYELFDRVVVITGAGSGIGRALAAELTDRGAHVAISDWDEASVSETARMIEGAGTKVMTASFDVSDRSAVESHAAAVIEEFGRADVIVNNAGVNLASLVETVSYEDLEWVIDIDFWGVVHGTKAFLPHLLERDEGAIVNVSSVFGMFGLPTQSGYNAAKFAVRGFTESLQQELADTGVLVSRVHPGGIKTGIVRHGRIRDGFEGVAPTELPDAFERAAATTPERAATIIADGIARRKQRILVGPDAHLLDLVVRTMPVRYPAAVRAFSRLAMRSG